MTPYFSQRTFAWMKNKNKQVAKIAGILIILGMIAGILSVVPVVERDNFLNEVYPNKNQVFTGAVFQFFLVPVYVAFPLLLYPILKQYNKTLSIGFVGFRFMAATFQILGIILLPIFVFLSEKYASASPADMAIYESAGDSLRLFRDLTNHLGVILATGLGNLLLYSILYREKLIPKWVSIWGFSGNIIFMTASFLILFQLIDVISTEYGLMSAPLIIQEIVLSIWLITKGLAIKVNSPLFNTNPPDGVSATP